MLSCFYLCKNVQVFTLFLLYKYFIHMSVLELPVEIIKPLKSVTVENGQPIILQCELSKANISVHWLKDEHPLDTTRCTVEVDGFAHFLHIPISNSDDEAQYSISVQGHTSNCLVLVEGELIVFCITIIFAFSLPCSCKQLQMIWISMIKECTCRL